MWKRDYANRVMFMLSFKEMSGYQLSKNIKHHGETMSSGTLLPILKNLQTAGLIDYRTSGNKKIYSLTGKGVSYIKSLREIGDEFRKRMFVETMDQNLLYYDILTNLEDVEAIKKVLNKFGETMIELIRTWFKLERSGMTEEADTMERRIRELLEGCSDGNCKQ